MTGPFLTAYVAIIGFITLTPRDDSKNSAVVDAVLEFLDRHEATAWMTFSVLERSANLLLFLPLGVLLIATLGRGRWMPAVAVGLGYSVFIESCQALLLTGRVADPLDIVMNGVGTAVGVALGHAGLTRREKNRT
jgi:glycopeptide antibiotics resistance protein